MLKGLILYLNIYYVPKREWSYHKRGIYLRNICNDDSMTSIWKLLKKPQN